MLASRIGSNSRQIFEITFSLVLFTLVFKASINSIAIITMLAAVILSAYLGGKLVNPIARIRPLLTMWAPFIALLLLTFYYGFESEGQFLQRNLPILLFPLIFLSVKAEGLPSREKVMKWLAILMFLFNIAIFSVAVYRQIARYPDFSEINWYFFSYRGLLAYFEVHATYLALLNNIVVLFLLSARKTLFGRKRILPVLIIISCALITILSGSRIGILILFVMLLYSVFISSSNKKIWIALTIGIATTALLFSIPIVKERVVDTIFSPDKEFKYAKYGNKPGDAASLQRRLDMNLCGWQLFTQSWVLGYGSDYESEAGLRNCYKNKNLTNALQDHYNVHNQYIGWLLHGGIFLFLAFLFLISSSVYSSVLRKDYLFAGFVMIILISCLTENILDRHFGIVYFAALNSLFFVVKKQIDSENLN